MTMEIIDAILGLAECLDPTNDILPKEKHAPRPRFLLELTDDRQWRAIVTSRRNGIYTDGCGATPEDALTRLHGELVHANEAQTKRAQSRLARFGRAAMRALRIVKREA